MNKYGMAAIEATHAVRINKEVSPLDAWEDATMRIFGDSSSQKKGCPKSTFLALCGMGVVKGIECGDYTKSKKNRQYAMNAVEYICRNTNIDVTVEMLWHYSTIGMEVKHNSQMDVVLALYENDMLEVKTL